MTKALSQKKQCFIILHVISYEYCIVLVIVHECKRQNYMVVYLFIYLFIY